MASHVKNIAIAGASGSVGGEITKALLRAGTFSVTAISRTDSDATFPTGVSVKKGSYNDAGFLESALQGQDVLIIVLGISSDPSTQTEFISAAATAGVPWVFPTEFGSDNNNARLRELVPIMTAKAMYREQIEKLGVSSWIGVINNPWFDYCMQVGMFGFNLAERKATLLDHGETKYNTTTLPYVGAAVARLLSLPIQGASPSLSDYKNKFVYIRSFSVSQRDILNSLQKATGTTDADWKIEQDTTDNWINDGWQRFKSGDFFGVASILYGSVAKEGLGDKYYGKQLLSEQVDGLPTEDFDQVVAQFVKQSQ